MLDKRHETNKFYVLGFFLSLLATLGAYFASQHNLFVGILGLGIFQAVVQFVCFMSVGRESKPHWNLFTFLFMVFIMAVVVIGSLWIMYNLDYRMM